MIPANSERTLADSTFKQGGKNHEMSWSRSSKRATLKRKQCSLRNFPSFEGKWSTRDNNPQACQLYIDFFFSVLKEIIFVKKTKLTNLSFRCFLELNCTPTIFRNCPELKEMVKGASWLCVFWQQRQIWWYSYYPRYKNPAFSGTDTTNFWEAFCTKGAFKQEGKHHGISWYPNSKCATLQGNLKHSVILSSCSKLSLKYADKRGYLKIIHNLKLHIHNWIFIIRKSTSTFKKIIH